MIEIMYLGLGFFVVVCIWRGRSVTANRRILYTFICIGTYVYYIYTHTYTRIYQMILEQKKFGKGELTTERGK